MTIDFFMTAMDKHRTFMYASAEVGIVKETVSSGDTAVVSTHQSSTQIPPREVPISGGGRGRGVSWTKVSKFPMISSNLGRGYSGPGYPILEI